ncbi:MAG: hypothetical protein AAGB14_06025 [Verrucomicrobiota bacterium]
MIDLSLMELAVAVIGLSMITVIFFSWVSRWSANNAERRSLKDRIVCRLCLAVFRREGRNAVVKCPECGARTNRGGPTALG